MEPLEPRTFTRKNVPLKDFKQFHMSSKTFERQYCSIYETRLALLKDQILNKAGIKWGKSQQTTISNLVQCTPNQQCIIIGTIYKHQEFKPSILKEIAGELQLPVQRTNSNYNSSKDVLYLEDETLRLKLVGTNMDVREIITGQVCAILGHEMSDGTFWVKDWCYPGMCAKPSSSAPSSKIEGKIVLLSGLDLTNNTNLFSLNLLSEWICGMTGCCNMQEYTSSIVRVVIAGNSVRGSIETYNHKSYSETRAHQQIMAKEAALAAHRLDCFLESIVRCCCVTLMPGEFDPVCHTLPQQPFHPCILPRSTRFKSLHGATNPWIGSIGSRIVTGSSGQPINDIMKVAGLESFSPLMWLEKTLLWQHFAPTAPDTLSTYPYFKTDPFIMTECPDIYFVGNMESFDTKLVIGDEGQNILLVSIPKFSETQTAVLVDLQDLTASPISFGNLQV